MHHLATTTLAVVAVSVALGAGTAGPAVAAGPTHFRETGSAPVDNFCDTGQTVVATNNTLVNVWGTPSDTTSFKVTESRKLTFTNRDNGATLLLTSAGLGQQVVSGNTTTFMNAGIQVVLREPGGPVLFRGDIGFIYETITFDADGNVIDDTVILRGQHSDTDFCDVAVPALGIT